MTISIEDILNSICSETALSNENDHQRIYSVSTPLEAKLAYEVLAVFGLDVKVYHQAEKPSKLYVVHPTFPPAQLQKIYAGALAYAKTLKEIKLSTEALCSNNMAALSSLDYNIALHTGQGRARNIVIQIVPSEDAQGMVAGTANNEPVSAPAAVMAVASEQPKALRKYGDKPKSHYEEISSGPAVGRGNYPGKLSAAGEAKANSTKRRLMLKIFAEMSASSLAMITMALVLGLGFSAFSMAKAFMCPDLAVANRNRAWYCGKYDDDPEKRQKKPTNEPVAPR